MKILKLLKKTLKIPIIASLGLIGIDLDIKTKNPKNTNNCQLGFDRDRSWHQ